MRKHAEPNYSCEDVRSFRRTCNRLVDDGRHVRRDPIGHQGRGDPLSVLISSGATWSRPRHPSTRQRNSPWRTSSLHLHSTRPNSTSRKVRAAVPQSEFRTELSHSQPVPLVAPDLLQPCVLSTDQASGAVVVEDEQRVAPPAAGGGRKRGRPGKKNSMAKCSYCRKKTLPCSAQCPHRTRLGEDDGKAAATTARAPSSPSAASITTPSAPMVAAPQRQVWRLWDLNQRSRVP